jgi:hypothetical protein
MIKPSRLIRDGFSFVAIALNLQPEEPVYWLIGLFV